MSGMAIKTAKATTADVRAWAKKHYDGIGDRGPIPAHVVADYKKSMRLAKR